MAFLGENRASGMEKGGRELGGGWGAGGMHITAHDYTGDDTGGSQAAELARALMPSAMRGMQNINR